MSLTPEEQARLDELDAKFAPKNNGLSAAEQARLDELDAKFGNRDSVLDEAHPDISATSRLVFKNFGNDNAAGIRYLSRENPDLEFKEDKSGEIIAKKKDETSWKKLDPGGLKWRGVKELAQDVGDIGYDVLGGVGQSILTGAAGVAGAGFGGGVGALPAAAATGALSGRAIEKTRQDIGTALGVNEAKDEEAVKIAGIGGMVSPLLLGTGATAAQIAKGAAKSGLAAPAIDAAQRGVVGRGYDATAGYLGPKIGSMMSGVNSEVIKKASDMLPELRIADTDPSIIVDNITKTKDKITADLVNKTREAGATMENVVSQLDDGGVRIASSSVLSPITKIQEKIKKQGMNSEAKKELLDEIQGTVDKYFSVESKKLQINPDTKELREVISKSVPDELSAGEVNSMYFELKELAKKYGFDYGDIGTSGGALGGVNRSDARVAQAFKEAATEAKNQIKASADKFDKDLSEKYLRANDDYGRFASFRDDFNNASKNEKSFSTFLGKVSKDPIYRKMAMDLSKDTGADVKNSMLTNEVFKLFSNPSTDALSIGGATSTSKTVPLALAGGTLGYMVGQQSGGEYSPYLMSAAGGLLGSRLGSPAAIRKMMELNKAARTSAKTKASTRAVVPAFTRMSLEERKNENK